MPEEGTAFLSPEALVIFPLAIILDLVGIVLVIFALDDFFITDVIGFATIGAWSFFRSQIKGKEPEVEISSIGEKRGTIKEVKQTKKAGKAAKWGKRLKFLELIPYVGALPFWTVSVYFELKS